MSTNQGQSWTLMAGGVGNPLIIDTYTGKNVNPAQPTPTPNGAEGRIVLAVPAATSNYRGGARSTRAGSTRPSPPRPAASTACSSPRTSARTGPRSSLHSLPPLGRQPTTRPSRPTAPSRRRQAAVQYAITDNSQGNLDLALTVDPQNPNITYLGGFGGNTYNSDTGLIRVDATNLAGCPLPGGLLYDQAPGNRLTLTGTIAVTTITTSAPRRPRRRGTARPTTVPGDPSPYLNFIRNPA